MAVAPVDEVEYGEVFTRRWVVETILDLVGYTADADVSSKTLVEPSVGSGAFLVPIIERLVASAALHGVPLATLTSAVRGYDLQADHVKTSRERIASVLESAGASRDVADELAKTWIHHADYLLDESGLQADFVVGNPPYIRTEDLDDDQEATYRDRWKTMKGRADIFVGFYERSLTILRPGGRLGFICADRWMRNQYGSALRALIGDRFAVETLWQMHDVDAFEAEVSAYPAITVLSNSQQGHVTVLETNSTFDRSDAIEAIKFVQSEDAQNSGDGWSGARLSNWFKGPELWPAGGPERIRLLEKLAERFPTLEETGGDTKIAIGLATGADAAYIVDADGDTDVEPDRLLPLVMSDDVRSGRLSNPAKALINPWDAQGNLVELSRYPRMEKALLAHPAVLSRYVARKNPKAWHRTIDKVNPGVAQKPKLLLQDMKAQITPVLEPGGYYPHHNLYYVTSTGWDLEVLGGLLLSRIAQAFIESYGVRMRGGTLRFQAQYLRKIRVPAPESIKPEIASRLKEAFRSRDRDAATVAAEMAYELHESSLVEPPPQLLLMPEDRSHPYGARAPRSAY
ncbi:Eco57I restriction-modification methylase domain-containing protein [Promicromonospora iranensis]|uniref:Eco57I restriction-modification methylase domain-containing protein n=1 Tax=Promicromonospora iranensis TaxID=1105144 RepID=UPI0023A93835|nr:N-6 DNA methylase [Promicromonospora iranensis]